MRKFVTDKENICLRCKNGYANGTYRPSGAPENLTWCTCQDLGLHGGNKGNRRQCKAFEPKTEGRAVK